MKSITIFDGGSNMELMKYVDSSVDGDPLWSARFNSTNPDAVIKGHLDFLRAGVQILLANTYQASVEGYMEYLNLTHDESIEMIKNTVKLAHRARKIFMEENPKAEYPKIFASLGAYGAHLHDGSEYTGNYAESITKDVLKKWHKVRLDAVMEAGVDGLAIETIPCLKEAESVVELIIENYPNIKFWTSFNAKDAKCIPSGEEFSAVAKTIWNKVTNGNLLAVGVNCVHPENVTPLFESVNGGKSESEMIPLIIYPNSGEQYSDILGWYGKEKCIPIDNWVPEWINLGAVLIGGCCRTTANDVKRIKQKIESLKLTSK